MITNDKTTTEKLTAITYKFLEKDCPSGNQHH